LSAWAFASPVPPIAQFVRAIREGDVRTLLYLKFLLLAVGLLGMVACGNGAQHCDFPPAIASLSPSSITAGGPQFMLTVNAQSFESLSTLQWNGAAQQTNVVNSGELTAVIPASDIANSGMVKISVHSPNTSQLGDVSPCGGDSNSFPFNINP